MRQTIYILSSLLLLLVAVGCGQGAETAVPNPINTDAQTVAAKPQLIEFYANW